MMKKRSNSRWPEKLSLLVTACMVTGFSASWGWTSGHEEKRSLVPPPIVFPSDEIENDDVGDRAGFSRTGTVKSAAMDQAGSKNTPDPEERKISQRYRTTPEPWDLSQVAPPKVLADRTKVPRKTETYPVRKVSGAFDPAPRSRNADYVTSGENDGYRDFDSIIHRENQARPRNISTQGSAAGLPVHSENDPLHPPIRTASFQGVKPGFSIIDDVADLWGKPVNVERRENRRIHVYSTDILKHIEVVFKGETVVSISVLFEEPFPESQVREVLKEELQMGKAVLIPDEEGKIIGEVFPEKGVHFLFAPEDSERPGHWVTRIGIEPVTAEPFVLRAEASMIEFPTESLRDLLDAVRINPDDAKAHWLLAQIQLMQGNIDAAAVSCEQAIRLDETRPAYHITLARIFIQMNRPEEAKQYLEGTLMISNRHPHEKAQALAILGDLYRTGAQPDYDSAIEFHSDAIRLASTLQNHQNSSIRLSAKETLFSAHLGAARDIAWGLWNDKEESIEKWIGRAEEIAGDPEVVKTKRISADFPFQLATTRLTTQVALPQDKDLKPHVLRMLQIGNKMIEETDDPILKRKYQWETGLALYDAVQIYQIRRQYTPALKYGEETVHYMESGIVDRRSDTDLYLLGRLYFRLGAIHAIGMKNHSAAIEWFDRAKPVFERLLPKINPEELGRLGETLVSMGVSYWEMNQQDEAIRLTERGLRQIEKGVKTGSIAANALIIPYSNLSTMYDRLSRKNEARKYLEMARELKTSGNEARLR